MIKIVFYSPLLLYEFWLYFIPLHAILWLE